MVKGEHGEINAFLKNVRISESVRAYGGSTIRIDESNKEQANDRCRYCDGRWIIEVAGTVNGKPLYHAYCSVCGLTTKDFECFVDLCDYIGVKGVING